MASSKRKQKHDSVGAYKQSFDTDTVSDSSYIPKTSISTLSSSVRTESIRGHHHRERKPRFPIFKESSTSLLASSPSTSRLFGLPEESNKAKSSKNDPEPEMTRADVLIANYSPHVNTPTSTSTGGSKICGLSIGLNCVCAGIVVLVIIFALLAIIYNSIVGSYVQEADDSLRRITR